MTKRNTQERELRSLKAELVLRGMSRAELAKKTGLAYGTIRNVLGGHHQGWGAKAAINTALGREMFRNPGDLLGAARSTTKTKEN
jgi:lambda repressor-like predicted transcriptional regulator